MTTPDFFNDVTPIIVRDPLSEVLGAASNGLIDYTYRDVVKLAGHSCPTVAGAFLMVQEGLKSLYGDETPVRGEIKVLMKGKLGDGVGMNDSVSPFLRHFDSGCEVPGGRRRKRAISELTMPLWMLHIGRFGAKSNPCLVWHPSFVTII